MIARFIIVAYAAGVILGAMSLIEWMVTRIARVWLAFLAAGLMSCMVGALGSAFVKLARKLR